MILHDEEWWGNLKADACQPKQDIERNVKPISFWGWIWMMTHVVHVLVRRWRFSQSLGKWIFSEPNFLFIFYFSFWLLLNLRINVHFFHIGCLQRVTNKMGFLSSARVGNLFCLFIYLFIYLFFFSFYTGTFVPTGRNGKEWNKMSIIPWRV